MDVINYGDIFFYDGDEYIYLTRTADVVFAAIIADLSNTQRLVQMENRSAGVGTAQKANHVIFSFVVLTTEGFKERAAHFAKPDHDGKISFDLTGTSLNQSDKIALKDKIENSGPTFKVLKELISQLDIT